MEPTIVWRPAASVRADAAAGVQQPPLFGKERRDFFEHFPVARRLLPGLRAA